MKKTEITKILGLTVVFCVAAGIASNAQTFTELRSLNGTNGWRPESLAQGADGNLYGTTQWGGLYIHEKGVIDPGDGTVFAMTPEGELKTLYEFCSQINSNGVCTDGQTPNSLVLAGNGNFYGTTFAGGTGGNIGAILQVGTIFEITPEGTLTTLHNFCTQYSGGLCLDGSNPVAGLVQGVNGNFYGTTQGGGTSVGLPAGGGTVFEMTAGCKLTTLYNFCSQTNCTDGAVPSASLLLDSDGNFYGTTANGGANSNPQRCVSGCGTIFKMTPAGEVTTLYNFCSKAKCVDGWEPAAALIVGPDGALYGTVAAGGDSDTEGGIVFRFTLGGKFSIVYAFCSLTNCVDGITPEVGLTLGTDGNFYGTTRGGGAYGFGSVYEITSSGSLTTLYSFCPVVGCAGGQLPIAGVTQATNGTFYGTVSAGGNLAACNFNGLRGCGIVYSVNTGLGAFVEANPVFGAVGKTVNILGNNLTGSTSVTFNGVTASFTVVSDTYIKATIPSGATSGTIAVTTPSGTLLSNVAFEVLP